MVDTQPLIAPTDEGRGARHYQRLLILALGVLAIGAAARVGIAVVADLSRLSGMLYAMLLLVFAPLALFAVALYGRAGTGSRRQLSIGLAVIAAMLTLVGYNRTSVWFMAVSVAIGAGCLLLSWDIAQPNGALGTALRGVACTVIAFVIVSFVILLVPAAFLHDGYLYSVGAATLLIGPVVVACVSARGARSRRRTMRTS
ncbi:hypothetical protein ACTJKO_05755 [Curtobacterium sp. 22159]|uniref:hypothetical protein n=1 Tax=Curtobacterium sp. 22159 TaxID=3453882 RepID=UPI003F875A42